MSDPIAFRRPVVAAPGKGPGGEAINIHLTIGPFAIAGPEPVWADVAAMVIEECQKQWVALHEPQPGA